MTVEPPADSLAHARQRARELANEGDIEGACAAALISIADDLAGIRKEIEWANRQRRHGR